MMRTIPLRLVLYTKDVALLIGQSERSARRLMNRIRREYNRVQHSFISIQDLCAFTGLSETKVEAYLREF